MQVNWTSPSLDDPDGIFEFIARDAPSYAQNFVQQIMQAVDRLETHPKSGRKIPEAGGDELREIIFQGYRIMYWTIDTDRIDIIAVVHGSRDMSNPRNQPWEIR